MKSTTSRRAVMVALPTLATIPALAGSRATPTDPHPAWMETWIEARDRWEELSELPENGNWDDPRSIECDEIKMEIQHHLRTVPAKTVAGAIACLTWLEEEMLQNDWLYEGHMEAFQNALDSLRAIDGQVPI